MRNPFLWLSGANQEVLARCPGERTKLIGLGGAVATTSLMATGAATYTALTMLHAPLPGALLIGLFWGVAIMNLDRWLLVTLRRQRSTWLTVGQAVPRVILALVTGLVISEPLVLLVFHNEVGAQAVQNRQEQLREGREKLNAQYTQIQRLQTRADSTEKALTTVDRGAVLTSVPQYRILSAERNRLQARLAAAQRASLCEYDGSCGTGREGSGPVYAAKQQLVNRMQAQVDAKQRELTALQTQLLHDEAAKSSLASGFNRGELARLRRELARLRAQQRADDQDLRHAYGAPIGLLDREEALGTLSHTHASMRNARYTFLAFILLLDSLPVFAKLITLFGRRNLYDRLLDDAEDRAFDSITLEHRRIAEAREIQTEIIVDEAKTRRKFQLEAMKELTAEVVAAQKAAGKAMVREWKKSAMAAAAAHVARHRGPQPANGTPASAPPSTPPPAGANPTGPRNSR